MAGAAGDALIALKDFAFELEGTKGTVADGIGHAIVWASPAALAPHEVVLAAALQHEGAFNVLLAGRYLVELLSVFPRDDGKEVGAQLADVAMAPAAIEHIVLSVVVAEDELVDGLCAVDYLVDERFAESIFVWAFGTVAYGHADASNFAFMHIVPTKEKVELVVSLDDCGSPKRATEPRDVSLRDDVLVLRPVHEVFARESVEVQLLVVGSAKRREDPVLSVEDSTFGVGIPTGEDRVAAGLFLLGISCCCDAA